MVELQELKIRQPEAKVRKVKDGFEGGLYTIEEAKTRKVEYNVTIQKTDAEVLRLRTQRRGIVSNTLMLRRSL